MLLSYVAVSEPQTRFKILIKAEHHGSEADGFYACGLVAHVKPANTIRFEQLYDDIAHSVIVMLLLQAIQLQASADHVQRVAEADGSESGYGTTRSI